MAITKAFKLAELIRHIEYDSTNDIITATKSLEGKNTKRSGAVSYTHLTLPTKA